MKHRYIIALVFIIATLMSIELSAQIPNRSQKVARYISYADSVYRANKKLLSEIGRIKNTSDPTISPYMYRISDPSTFYSNAVKNQFALNWKAIDSEKSEEITSEGMVYRSSLNNLIDKALLMAYIERSTNFLRYDGQFNNEELLSENRIESRHDELDAILSSAPVIEDVTKVIEDVHVDLEVQRPNFWKKSGKFTTQFTQSYFSNNWYKGGSNNVTLLSTLLLEANYNDQNKIQWDNKLDLRLGFVSTPSDEFHKFMTNNDKIYLYTKLGIKATKSWFYTIQADANSQFMPGYRTNKKDTFSKFLAPLDVFVSIGMDFKPKLKKGTFSAVFFPLSYKMRYINDKENNIFNDNGDHVYPIHNNYAMIKDGNILNTKHDFGSKVELNAKFDIVKNLTWRSRFYYYTTYKYAESEWENGLSFQFNKYLSTEVNALLRFDDNRPIDKKDSSLGYFQFKEYFTFGLAYNF